MKINQEILEIIEQGRTEGNLYFLPDYQLDRKTYQSVNKVLECLGGKWNRKLKAHLFESDISDAIDNVLLTGEAVDKKKEFQFFETPPEVVDQLIALAEIQPYHSCLEPSAGRGSIAHALCKHSVNVTCVELDPENAKHLVVINTHIGNFLEYDTAGKWDRIVMNPPFTQQQDIQHVEKALPLLAPGGILVSVMSAGVKFRTNKRATQFKEKLSTFKAYEFIDLPEGAFKVSGTNVNTVILKVTI